MRIISDYKDYYDYASSYGIDKTIVYNRKQVKYDANHYIQREVVQRVSLGRVPKHVELAEDPAVGIIRKISSEVVRLYQDANEIMYFSCNASPLIIGFCGKVYLGLACFDKNEKFVPVFNAALTGVELPPELTLFVSNMNKSSWFTDPIVYLNATDGVEFEQFREMMIENKIVSFAAHGRTVITNPRLLDYGFNAVVDPLTAFSELSMYIPLLKEAPEPEAVSDVLKAESKGFDKGSFRHRK